MSKALAYLSSIGVVMSIRVSHEDLHTAKWIDSSPYDSYVWNPTKSGAPTATQPGSLTRTAKTASGKCEASPVYYTKDDFSAGPVTSNQAQFMKPSTDPNYEAKYAYDFDAGYIEEGFGKWTALGHGTYCPTEDPNFFYNKAEDSFLWYNWVNGKWNMGKPSVTWWWHVDASTPRGKPPCQTPADGLPECKNGILAPLDGANCPTCITPNGKGPDYGSCDETMITECPDPSTIEECAAGTRPARDVVSCCPLCRVAPACDATKAGICMSTMEGMEECADADAEANSWNEKECCFTCKRRVTVTRTGECTEAMIAECVANTHVCLDSEEPTVGGDAQQGTAHCCPSCQRPGRQWSCDANLVALCEAETRTCAADETPQVLAGECCPSCKVVSNCANPCVGTQVCGLDSSTESWKCLDTVESTATVTVAATGALKDEADKVELAAVLSEIVTRYCDVPGRAGCEDGTAAELKTTLEIKEMVFTAPSSGTRALTMTFSAAEVGTSAGGRRRLLSTTDLVNAALNDLDAARNFLVKTTTTSTTAAPITSPPVTLKPKGEVSIITETSAGSASGPAALALAAMLFV